ncbi:HDIG domain-containing metalloprotein [Desulfoluna sp.]|uniref:HD family phosphohydrolase n=1 Tax=Desulfoluna sp. TaxID=2045199 RepID=UPI002610439C|nr:HDIG domain-containing metalloprotein [Desulfoluna sp.]
MNLPSEKRLPLRESVRVFFATSSRVLWVLLAAITLFFTLIIYPNLSVTKFSYNVGDIAEKNIKAPRDFFIQDDAATESSRKLAIRSVLPVYDHNTEMVVRQVAHVRSAFSTFRTVLTQPPVPPPPQPALDRGLESSLAATPLDEVWLRKQEFEDKMGIEVSRGAFQVLETHLFSKTIENLICRIYAEIVTNGVVANKALLLRQGDRGITLRTLDGKEESIAKNLKAYYGLEQAQTMVRIVADPLFKQEAVDVDYTALNLIVDFAQRMLRPNITVNGSETEIRARRFAEEVKPVLFKVKVGEMILREGERVTELQLVKLRELQIQTQNRHIFSRSIGAAMITAFFILIAFLVHFHPRNEGIEDRNKNMFFLATVLITFLLVAKVSLSVPGVIGATVEFDIQETSVYFGMPVAAGAMTVCLFMGLDAALFFSIVFAALVTLVFSNQFTLFIYIFLSSSMAAFWLKNCRERKVFIKAGAKLGLFNVALAAGVMAYANDVSVEICLWSAFFAFTGGLASGIVTAGIAPLLEMLFDYTTDIKLLELANLDQPILRRLMIEAPGTYNHSVIVGTLADAVASEIGANPLLARVCGYYHDIGKIEKAQYFIENQTDGKNRHDKLAPSMSALILTGHVKSGIEIARQYRLGQTIMDTIQQHHGTSLIEFFYEKAKAQKEDSEETVNADNFRYPGPKPQTVEAAIVMISDVLEAATRALDNPTPARIQGLVQNLINKIFVSGQLDYSEITLKDLHNMAKRFNVVLSGINHHRIKYPEKSGNGQRAKNGDSNRQSSGEAYGSSGRDTGERDSHLKRLGIT